jgi:hypothetical protein
MKRDVRRAVSNVTRRQFMVSVGGVAFASSLAHAQPKQEKPREAALATVTLIIDGMT